VLLAPSYFSRSIDLGTLMQLRIVVSRVSESLCFPISAYEMGISWRAATNRLAFLQTQAQAYSVLQVPDAQHAEFRAEDLSVKTPEGRHVVRAFSVNVGREDRVVVLGDAGSGKSLLVKALAGVWSYSEGQVERPANCMFAQGFDFPPLTMEGLLAYPARLITANEASVVLVAVGAGNLCQHLGTNAAHIWASILSREEQERIQLARVLVRQPEFVIFDEPLSTLDVAEARSLMSQLFAKHPSIGMLMFSRTRNLTDGTARVVRLPGTVSTETGAFRQTDTAHTSSQPRQRGSAQPGSARRGSARSSA
jgi:putative ATP-binding cassette transporter